MSSNGWIGVDFDGTLATYDGWKGPTVLGEPIPAMLERVKGWLAEGKDVRIFTARVWADDDTERYIEAAQAHIAIMEWCRVHLGKALPVTCQKDMHMVALWDDRCVQVETNTGRRMDGQP